MASQNRPSFLPAESRLGPALDRTLNLSGEPMRNVSITIAALWIVAGVCQGQETLTLEQAVAVALENNRGLRSSGLEAEKAQDKLNANRTRQFPNISIYALGAQQLQSFDFT